MSTRTSIPNLLLCLAVPLLLCTGGLLTEAAEPVSGDSVIRAKAGASEIVITTTSRLAGAIHSLTWNGQEFIDSADHGRQLQSAANFDAGRELLNETFNPTEAGSRRDGAGDKSSSKLLSLTAQGNVLETTCQMAYWLAPGEKSADNLAYNETVLSNHVVKKRVEIGYRDLPHVIQYDVTYNVPPHEKHRRAVFEVVTGYLPPEFNTFWRYDAKHRKLEPLSDGPGEQSQPVVLATKDSRFAMGIYSPGLPQREHPEAGYGRFRFHAEKVVKWNCVYRVSSPTGITPGDYRFQTFVLVGSLADVQHALDQLTTP